MHGAEAGRRPQANPPAIKAWLTVPGAEPALQVLTACTLGLYAHELVKPLAREWALEPVEELRGRVGLVVMFAIGEDGELKAAVRSAETLGHPLTLAQTLCLAAAFVHIFRHEPPEAAGYAERTLRICEEHRIAQYHAIAVCVNGWALSASGESEKGLAQIGQGLDSYGLGGNQHILLALQADAQLTSGNPEAALASVAAGLEAVENAGGTPPLEAELHRLRGEALLTGAGRASEAETAMQQGIDVARRQNAKSWELRGATSLARLRRQQGRREEAIALLAPIYTWFTEGFDTADLKEARTLLDKLTEPAIAAEG